MMENFSVLAASASFGKKVFPGGQLNDGLDSVYIDWIGRRKAFLFQVHFSPVYSVSTDYINIALLSLFTRTPTDLPLQPTSNF